MYENYFDEQVNWLDDPEIRVYKTKVLNSLTEWEKAVIIEEEAGMNGQIIQEEDFSDEIIMDTVSGPPEPEFDYFEEIHGFFDGNADVAKAGTSIIKTHNTCGLMPSVPLKPVISCDTVNQEPYFYEEGTLYYKPYGSEQCEIIGNFCICVLSENCTVNEIVNEQNVVIDCEESVVWHVCILCMGNKYEADVTLSSLSNEKELLKITHDRAYLEPEKEAKKAYRRYLNFLISAKNYTSVVKYPSTGWVNYSKVGWIYLTNMGAIGHPELNVRSIAPYSFMFDDKRIGSPQIFDEFFGLRNLCPRKLAHSVFLMHFACLATLTTLFQEAGHGINFVVVVVGPTNSQKTSVAVIFSRLFDRSTKSIPDIRFNSTEVAILEKMDAYGDAILLADDLLPFGNKLEAREQLKKSETIIRSYGDRVPRKRSKAYAKMNGVPEYNRVKGCCIMTGEVFEANSESSLTRVIQIPFERGDVDLHQLTFYQENLLNVPTFLYDFISYAGEHVEQIFQLVRASVKAARTDASLDVRIPRFRDTVGILRAEITLFYQYAYERGRLSMEECKEAAQIDEELIRQVICMNDANTKVLSPAALILTALKKAFDSNYYIKVCESDVRGVVDFSQIVIETEDFLIILPDALWNVYAIYCREHHIEVTYNTPRKIGDPLKKEGVILIKEEGGRPRGTFKIGASTEQRFFYIKKAKYAELTQALEEF